MDAQPAATRTRGLSTRVRTLATSPPRLPTTLMPSARATPSYTVIPLLFETFGGFSPAAMRLLRRLRDQVSNTLSHAQYEETTWSARSWMAFQAQKISVALHLAAALEIACDLGHAGARAAEAAA